LTVERAEFNLCPQVKYARHFIDFNLNRPRNTDITSRNSCNTCE